MDEVEKKVVELIDKATKAALPHEAMNYAQAALNAAHAAQVLAEVKRDQTNVGRANA